MLLTRRGPSTSRLCSRPTWGGRRSTPTWSCLPRSPSHSSPSHSPSASPPPSASGRCIDCYCMLLHATACYCMRLHATPCDCMVLTAFSYDLLPPATRVTHFYPLATTYIPTHAHGLVHFYSAGAGCGRRGGRAVHRTLDHPRHHWLHVRPRAGQATPHPAPSVAVPSVLALSVLALSVPWRWSRHPAPST